MMVPLLGPRLCKVYQSFWNDIFALDLFIDFKFCESDFYFPNGSTKCMVATYNFSSVYIWNIWARSCNCTRICIQVFHKRWSWSIQRGCIYCKFGNFRENFNFANSLKRHTCTCICHVTNSRQMLDLPTPVNDRVFRTFTSVLFSKFCEN